MDPTDERVDVTELDDAALEKAMAEGDPSPSDSAGDSPADGKPGDQPASGEKDNKPTDEKPNTDEGSGDRPPEGGDTEAGNEPDPGPAGEKSDEDRLTAMEKQLRDQKAFIDRQAAEIGQLRKAAPRVDVERIREEIRERFLEDPVKATRELRQLDDIEASQKRGDVIDAIPDFSDLVDDMVEVARAEGVSPEVLDAFKRDPYRPPIGLLSNLATKAREAKRGKQGNPEVESLRKQLEESTKRYDSLFERIDKAAREGKPLSSRDGGDPGPEGKLERVREEDLPDLPDAELDELLRKATAGE